MEGGKGMQRKGRRGNEEWEGGKECIHYLHMYYREITVS